MYNLNNEQKKLCTVYTSTKDDKSPNNYYDSAKTINNVLKVVKKTASITSKVYAGFDHNPYKLSNPIEIYGELCTHHIGNVIFGSSEEAVSAIYKSIEAIGNESTHLYNFTMKQIIDNQIPIVALEESLYLAKNGSLGEWGGITDLNLSKLGFNQTSISIDLKNIKKTYVEAFNVVTIDGVVAHEWLHEYFGYIHRKELGLKYADPIFWKTAEEQYKVLDTFSEAHKQFKSMKNLTEAEIAVGNTIFKPDYYLKKTFIAFDETNELIDSIHKLSEHRNNLSKLGEEGKDFLDLLEKDLAKKHIKLESSKLRLQESLDRFCAEVPTHLLTGKVSHNTEAFNKVSGNLGKIIDKISGIPIFQETRQEATAIALERKATETKNANISSTGKSISKILTKACFGLEIYLGIKEEGDIKKGIVRGLTNFPVSYITGPFELIGKLAEMGPPLDSKMDIKIPENANPLEKLVFLDMINNYHMVNSVKNGLINVGKAATELRQSVGDNAIHYTEKGLEVYAKLENSVDNQLNKGLTPENTAIFPELVALKSQFQIINKIGNGFLKIGQGFEFTVDTIIGFKDEIVKFYQTPLFDYNKFIGEKIVQDDSLGKDVYEHIKANMEILNTAKDGLSDFGRLANSLQGKISNFFSENQSLTAQENFLENMINHTETLHSGMSEFFSDMAPFAHQGFAKTGVEKIIHDMTENIDKAISFATPPPFLPDTPFIKGIKDQLEAFIEKECFSEEDVTALNRGEPIHPNDYTPLLATGKLNEKLEIDLQHKIKAALPSNLEIFEQSNPHEMAQLIERLEKSEISSEEATALLNAIEKQLPTQNEIEIGKKLRNERVKEAKELREGELAQLIKLHFDLITTTADEILGFVKANAQISQHISANDERSKEFQQYIAKLGINAQPNEFYNRTLYDVRALLESKFKDGLSDDVNQWLVNAEEYERAVERTRKCLNECRSNLENLNDKGYLSKLAKDLRHQQKKLDSKFGAISKLQNKIKAATAIGQSGAALLYASNPVSFALVQGVSSVVNSVLNIWAHSSERQYRHAQKRLNERAENISNCANALYNARLNGQNQIITLLERARAERAVLLFDPNYFTPLKRKQLLEEAIVENNKLKEPTESKKRECEKLIKELEEKIKRIEMFKTNPKLKKKYLEELNLNLLNAKAKLSETKIELQLAEDTLTNWRIDNDNYTNAHKEICKDQELPLHLRDNANLLPLEVNKKSSEEYLEKMKHYEGDQDPKKATLFHNANAVNGRIQIVSGFELLQNTSDALLSKVVPGIVTLGGQQTLELIKTRDNYKKRIRDFIDQEAKKRKKFDKATGDRKIRLEAQLAKLVQNRIQYEMRLNDVNNSLAGAEQLILQALERTQYLPPAARLAIYKQLTDDFSNKPLSEKQRLLAEKAFPLFYCLQLESAAEKEEINFADENKRGALYKASVDRCFQRREKFYKENLAIDTSNLSEDDKEIMKAQNIHSAKIIQADLEGMILNGSHDFSMKIVEKYRGSYFLTPFERELMNGYSQALSKLAQDNLPNQLIGLCGAVEGLALALSSPEWYKKHAIEFRLATASASAIAAVTYLIGAAEILFGDKVKNPDQKNLGIGTQGDSSQELTAEKGSIRSIVSPIANISKLGLLLCSPTLTIPQLIVPTLTSITSITEVVNLYNRWKNGEGLPETELQTIQRKLKELPQQIANGLKPTLDSIANKLNDLDDIQACLKENHQKLNEVNKNLNSVSKELSSKLRDGFLSIKDDRIKDKIYEQNQRIQDQSLAIDSKLLSHNKPKESMNFLRQLITYSNEYSKNNWNGQLVSGIDLKDVVVAPHLFVGFLANLVNAKGSFIAPEILLKLGKSFFDLNKLTEGIDLSDSFIKKHEYLRLKLINQCNSLKWLYSLSKTQCLATFNTFQELKWLYYQYPSDVQRKALAYKSSKFEGVANKRKECNLNKVSLAPEQKIDVLEVIKHFYTPQKLVSGFHPLADVKDKISLFSKRNLNHFDNYNDDQCRVLLMTAGPVGLAAAGVVAVATAPWAVLLGSFYAIIGMSGAAVGGLSKDLGAIYDGLSSEHENRIMNRINRIFAYKFTGPYEIIKKPEPLLPKVVKISWIATESGLEIEQISVLTRHKIEPKPSTEPFELIEENFPLVGKILEFQKGKRMFPLLKVTTNFNWNNSGRTTIYYDPQSYFDANDIQKIYKIENITKVNGNSNSAICDYQYMGEIYAKTAGLELSEGSFEIETEESVNTFKTWLGEYELIPNRDGSQWPVILPKILIARIQEKISRELDLNYIMNDSKAVLQPKFEMPYIEGKGFDLRISYCDKDGESYIDFNLGNFSKDLVETRTGIANADKNISKNEQMALLVYLFYGEHWGIGITNNDYILLENKNKLFISDRVVEKGSFYNQLKNISPLPLFTSKGKWLQETVANARNALKTSKEFAEYEKQYHLLRSLIKLTYETDDLSSIDRVLSSNNFVAPNEVMFDEIETKKPKPEEVFNFFADHLKTTYRRIEKLHAKLSGTYIAKEKTKINSVDTSKATPNLNVSFFDEIGLQQIDKTVDIGNSLFDNIAYQVGLAESEISKKGLELRQNMVEFMRKNKTDYDYLTNKFNPVLYIGDGSINKEYDSFDDYLNIMKSNLTCGGNTEIKALAHYLDMPIISVSETSKTVRYNKHGKNKMLFIEHVGSRHYVLRTLRQGVYMEDVMEYLKKAHKQATTASPVPVSVVSLRQGVYEQDVMEYLEKAHKQATTASPVPVSVVSLRQGVYEQDVMEYLEKAHKQATTASPVPVSVVSLPKGITNLGTSCYINSAIQALIAIPLFKKNIMGCVSSEDVIDKLQTFITRYEEPNAKPSELKAAAINFRLAIYKAKLIDDLTSQNDPASVIEYVLVTIGESFEVQTKRKTITTETMSLIQVGLTAEMKGSFQDIINQHFKETTQNEGIEAFREKIYITSTPPLNIQIQLKRFDNKGITIPTAFNLSNMEINMADAFESQQKVMYQIKGGIIHIGGTIHGGHYHAIVEKNGNWFLCNDDKVTAISKEDAAKRLSIGYILFLEKS